MASLLNMSGGSLLMKGLPYDAEIEYLKGDGYSYILTNYYPIASSTEIEIKQSGAPNWNGDWGVRSGGGSGAVGIANGYVYRYSSYGYIGRYGVFYIGKGIVSLDGVEKVTYSQSDTNRFIYPIVLFGWANCSTDPATMSGATIYYFKIWENDVLVRDFIPVRVGTTGYMYDKVRGQLFGNAGTGNFILGPDK